MATVLAIGCAKNQSSSPPPPQSIPNEVRSDKTASRQEIKRKIEIMKTYLAIRSGQPPESRTEKKTANLARFTEAFLLAQRLGFIDPAPNCQRFWNLFNQTGSRTVELYSRLLLDPPTHDETYQSIQAHIYILDLVINALAALVTNRSEGGFSIQIENDAPSIGNMCATKNREQWLNRLNLLVDRSRELKTAFFGNPSLNDETKIIENYTEDIAYLNTDDLPKRIGFGVGEVAVALVAWIKLGAPILRHLSIVFPNQPWRFIAATFITTSFLSTSFSADRYIRRHIQFLKPLPPLTPANQSEWDRIINFGEDNVLGSVLSPPLYFGFLQVSRLAQREANLNFINKNVQLLSESEAQFGSVDEALRVLEKSYNLSTNEP